MENTTSALRGYKLDFAANTLTLNYKFTKAAQEYDSPEYKLLQKLIEDFPSFQVITQSGRVQKKPQKNKRLTYNNMKKHISAYSNAEDLLVMFDTVEKLSKPLKSPYKYVSDWFKKQFPDYDTAPVLNSGKITAKILPAPDVGNYERKPDEESAAAGT